jgi:putative resolvase
MTHLVTIKEAAEFLGVSTKTIRRWEQEGKVQALRTSGGHRRFRITDLFNLQSKTPLTIGYTRVNSLNQKPQLDQQINLLKTYFQHEDWNYDIIQDIGSGVNYRNKGLIRLVKLICNHQVKRLVLTHKDRLLRLGADLILALCEMYQVEVVILNNSDNDYLEDELNQDLQEIASIFNTKPYSDKDFIHQQAIQRLESLV